MSLPDASITTLIQEHLIERLTQECIDDIPVSDSARVEEVVRDSLQKNPTKGIYISVFHQQPRSPDVISKPWRWSDGWGEWIDREDDEYGSEIGCGQFWLRRYTIYSRAFFLRSLDEADARRSHGALMARMTRCLRGKNNAYPPLADAYGESLVMLKSLSAPSTPQGGPKAYIYESLMRVEFLTYAS